VPAREWRSAGCDAPPWRVAGATRLAAFIEGTPAVSDKSPQKSNAKKQGKTLKEKRAAKKLKKATKSSPIPPTGH